MKRALSTEGKGALELIEESFFLVRHTGLTALPVHWLASFPFVLGLLYFISDMSRSAFAQERLLMGSLVLTFLFLGMKCGQAWYAAILRSRLSGADRPVLTPGKILSLAARESFLQATGLIMLPLALLLLLPFGWVYAFYSNATVLAAQPSPENNHAWKRAWSQATLWPAQNHYGLLALKLFFIFVALNIGITMIAGPLLLKILLGWDTVFSQSPLAMLNTTFLTATLAVAYLCVDPLTKAFYTVRCFHGESLSTGSDLLSNLKRPSALPLFFAAGLLMVTGSAGTIQAAPDSLPSAPPAISPQDLDQSIDEVIQKREYTWRLPRDKRPDHESSEDSSLLADMAESLSQSLGNIFQKVGQAIEDFMGWLNLKSNPNPASGSAGSQWLSLTRFLLIALLAVLGILILLLLIRFWKKRTPTTPDSPSPPSPAPDVTDESVGADALPENEWIELAEKLTREGDFRLALRAFYLASLAHLAQRNLLTIARFKSNLDYMRELDRHSHALPEVHQIFRVNVAEFDQAWYGLHEVSSTRLQAFAHNVTRLCQVS